MKSINAAGLQVNPIITTLMEEYSTFFGQHYERYHHHVCRIYLLCCFLDKNRSVDTDNQYAIAAVFHDIGIWTDKTIDYIDPSIGAFRNHYQGKSDLDWMREIEGMIYWHHKVSRYRGFAEEKVEVFRKADWIDVTLGMKLYNVDRSFYGQLRSLFPYEGFHRFLVKSILRNFVSHPLKPLPMFRV